MSLAAGQRLGPYEILSPLGEGGMGSVWKARDTRLNRTVAIKVSKAEFTDRFEREARAVAALNHPRICQLYDIGPEYLVMEYIEGTPLSGPLPAAQAIEYGVQILDALDAAHRKGVVHRDLKPANILVTRQGIKLLDFGLAKHVGTGLKETDATLTEALTGKGQITGTLHYMSPEQLQGQEADARSDIFSFGLVLYEMLSGKRAFEAGSAASLIASVLKEEPTPIRDLQPSTPPALERVLKICLAKDREDRWQSARDLRRELAWVGPELSAPAPKSAGAVPARSPKGRLWPLAAAIVLALGLGFGAAHWLYRPPTEAAELLPLTTLPGVESSPAISPDGKLVAFTWTGADFGNPKICVKQLDAGEPLVLSRGSQSHGSPTWSPDGRQIAYLREGSEGTELMVVSALGGAERRVGAPWDGEVNGGLRWLPKSGQIVGSGGPLVALAADSGMAKPWTKPPTGRSDLFPALSPDGRSLAFVRTVTVIAAAPAEIFVQRLNAGQQPEGEPVAVASGLNGVAGMDWAPDGKSLIVSAMHRSADHLFRIAVPGGKTEMLGGVAAAIAGGGLSISPSTRRMAVTQAEGDVDIFRAAGPSWPASEKRPEPQLFLSSTRDDLSPNYSPDGKRIAFESDRTGNQEIWLANADGQDAVQLTNFDGPPVGTPRWSPDGSKLAFDSRKLGNANIFVIAANGGPAIQLTTGPADHIVPSWSSDGKWIYYASSDSGRLEIWKSPAGGGAAVQVSHDGGNSPTSVPGEPFIYWWWDSIFRQPEAGGAVEKLIDFGSGSLWVPMHDGIVLMGGPYADPLLAFYRFRDRQAQVLQHVPRAASPRILRKPTITVSPDGKWILYSVTSLDRADLMLVENFH